MKYEPKWTTPGPWFKVTTGNVGNLIETADHKIVGSFQSTHWRADREDEASANGALISAAPELYAALAELVLEARIREWEGRSLDKAELALAKARGEQP